MLKFFLQRKSNKATVINGFVAKGYEPLETHFKKLYTDGYDTNSQLCVYVNDQKVVDLVGSTPTKNPDDQQFDGESLHTIYSNGKTVSNILLAMLFDQGLFKYDDLVS
jgi:CubicO group peptidase (beta-lactamase class C family)